jgi:signal transduction histidine kinase
LAETILLNLTPLTVVLLLAFVGCRERRIEPKALTSDPDYDKGVTLLNAKPDSAFYYFNKIATASKDSLPIARAFNRMGYIQTREGDFFGGQESLLTSLRYLRPEREGDQYCLLSDYNVLGSNSLDLKNYDSAISYYGQALKWIKENRWRAIALNNMAVAYQKKGDYARAIRIYESILDSSKKVKKEYARVLSNLARARWQRDPGYTAAPELIEALRIRETEKDEWGLNTSYSHLADYYARSKPDSALQYAREMYAIASRLNSPDDELEALQKLISIGPGAELKGWFGQYEGLQDSLTTARNRAKNQFALIRFEVEKNKSDNLRLQRENAEKRVEMYQERVVGGGIVAVLVVLSVWGVFWYRKRTQRLRWEKERAVREERLQVSQKVHDVVANGLYRVITQLEHGKDPDKEKLLDEIDALYQRSRDISYEPVSGSYDFQVVVKNLLLPFGESGTKVLITGNEKELWDGVDPRIKKALEATLLELMINMKKHSGASNVLVRFERDGDRVSVQYADDGVGFPVDFRYGNGLTNTENRIGAIGGKVIFGKNSPKGATIAIDIPGAAKA